MTLSGKITAEASGDFEFGLSVVGKARLFVNNELVIDNGWVGQQTAGSSFYGKCSAVMRIWVWLSTSGLQIHSARSRNDRGERHLHI